MRETRRESAAFVFLMTDDKKLKTLQFLHWLKDDCGYLDIRLINQETYIAIIKFMFTAAIIRGRVGNHGDYDDRWCYHNVEAARSAIAQWDGIGEPKGWHRHPMTGRRRPDGDESQEYIHQ